MAKCLAFGCRNDARRNSLFCGDVCLEADDRRGRPEPTRRQKLSLMATHISNASDLQELKDILANDLLPLLEED